MSVLLFYRLDERLLELVVVLLLREFRALLKLLPCFLRSGFWFCFLLASFGVGWLFISST